MPMKNPTASLCLTLLFATSISCKGLTTPNEKKDSDVPLAEIIDIDASTTSLPADGSSTVRVSARIPVDASTKTVTFTTTAGLFLESADKKVTIFAQPDSVRTDRRLATTLLRSDTSAVRAIIRATVGEYYDTTSVVFTKP